MQYPADRLPGGPRPRRLPRAYLAPLVLLALVLAGCREAAPAIGSRFPAFGTQTDLSLVGVSPAQAERATATIRSDFELLERELDPWAPGPLGRVNLLLAKGEPFVAPPSVLPLIRLSQGLAQQSGGLLNPAAGRLTELWGFNRPIPECHPPPGERAIRRLVEANPQISDLRLEGLELQGRNPAVLLDFGGMIRGYAVDLAIETLRGLGVRDAQVQVGSDLRAIGDRSGQPWRVPIRRASGSGVLGVLHLRGDEAVSSLYANDRTFVYGGATYHSILDPRTGWPARDTLAVTVAHRDATTASAAAAALFLAGPQRWHEVAGALGLRYVLLVDGRGAVQLSPEMRDRFDLVERSATLSVAPPLGPPPAAQAAGASRPAGAGGERR